MTVCRSDKSFYYKNKYFSVICFITDPAGQSKNQQADLLEDEVSEEAQTSVEKFTLVIDQSAEADFTPEEGEVSTEDTGETASEGPAVLYVRSK